MSLVTFVVLKWDNNDWVESDIERTRIWFSMAAQNEKDVDVPLFSVEDPR